MWKLYEIQISLSIIKVYWNRAALVFFYTLSMAAFNLQEQNQLR